MPTYVLECTNSECAHKFEMRCSFTSLQEHIEKEVCPLCKSKLTNKPVAPGRIQVNGYSEANGYTRENLNYDGSNRPF